MPSSEQNSPSLPYNETNIPADYHITDNNNKGVMEFQNKAEGLLRDTKFRKDVGEYHAPYFIVVQVRYTLKYSFMT